jgi:hypothetical protein
MLNIQNETQNLEKFAHFEKFILIQQLLTYFLITSCEKILSKILHMKK